MQIQFKRRYRVSNMKISPPNPFYEYSSNMINDQSDKYSNN
jgi:hypothetical protein